MKQIIAFTLALAVACTLISCKDENGSVTTPQGTTENASQSETTRPTALPDKLDFEGQKITILRRDRAQQRRCGARTICENAVFNIGRKNRFGVIEQHEIWI